jgi:hypothetical protein
MAFIVAAAARYSQSRRLERELGWDDNDALRPTTSIGGEAACHERFKGRLADHPGEYSVPLNSDWRELEMSVGAYIYDRNRMSRLILLFDVKSEF